MPAIRVIGQGGAVNYATEARANRAYYGKASSNALFQVAGVPYTWNGTQLVPYTAGTARPVPIAPPATPTLTASTTVGGQVDLSWTISNGPLDTQSLTALVNGITVSLGITASSTSFSHTGLTPGVSIPYSLFQSNPTGDAAAMASATPTAAGAPAAPVITVTPGNNQNTIAYAAAPGSVTAINATRVPAFSTPPTLALNSTGFVDATAVNGTAYSYTVYFTSAGGTTGSAPVSGTPVAQTLTANNVPPAQAPVLTAVNGGIIARFYPNYGVTAQTVTYTPASGTPTNVPVSATDTYVTINGLTAGTVYTITYSSTNSTGTSTVGSATATPLSGTNSVVPAPNGTAGALRNRIYAPTPPADTVSHRLQQNATVLIATSAPSGPINFTHTGLTAGTSYNYFYYQTNATGVTTQSAALSLTPGPAQAGTYAMWLQYGQSLSIGFNGGAGLTTTAHPRNRMFGSGMVSPLGATLLTTLPAKEASQETGMAAGGTLYATLTDTLVGGGQHHDLLLTTFGVGGTGIGALKKGGTQAYYQRLLDGVLAGKQDALDGGYTWAGVPVITWIHGESAEQALEATYRADVEQLRVDLVADIKAITGQTNDPKFLVSQTSSHTYYAHTTPYAAIEQYKSFKAAPSAMLLSGAKYHLPYATDGLHLSNIGYRILGEQFGYIMYRILELGQNWRPLYPTAVTGAGTVTITGTFNVPTGALALDTTLVTDPGNYGFEVAYQDATAAPAITSVALSGGNQVVVTLASALTKAAYLRYAYTGTSGAKAGATTGARGNLRDSETQAGTDGPLYNWCVHFQEVVS